jgi:predicted ATPase/DNA-binding SARP family transcriptional activator
MSGNANGADSEPGALEYGVLGPLEVRRDGVPLRLGGCRQRGLLAYLLLHANRSVRTEDLVNGLWRDPPASCRKIVQISVSQIRRSIGDHQLATEAYGYRLVADPMAIDLHRFRSLVTHGRDALARGDAAAAANDLGQALALWRGPAFADLDEEPFVAAERMHLEELRLAATEDRIDAELALGHEHALIGELEGLVAGAPLRERPRAQLMIALYRAGRQPEALGVYQNARKVLLEQVGIEPGHKLKRLERAILRQDGSLEPAATVAHRTELPSPPNRLIGRERELVHVCAALRRDDVRVLTITGPGGVGKTRVAIEAARRLAPDIADGAAFVALDGVVDPSLVAVAIDRALGERPGARTDLPALRERLSGRSLLLVLDSFEHLTAASTLLAELARMAPMLKLLVTSRVSLRLSCEHELVLGSLPVPARNESDPAALAGSPAVELFLERARAVRPELALDGTSTAAVAEICRRLDGLPLSIELAAARTKFLAPPALLARLGRRLDLLVAGPLDAPARHRTLRATVDWSYQLLSAAEQQLFARLGVFVGGCELEAAEAVCGDSVDVLATLEGLAGHSLVRREAGPNTRIAMLETLREFALDLVESTGEAETLRARHAEWYLGWAESAEAELIGPQQADWLRRLEDDHANLVAALAWFDRAGDGPRLLRLASALWHYWRTNGYFTEARQWLSCGIAAPGESPPIVRAKALRHAANFARQQLDAAAAQRLAAEALVIARTTKDVPTLAGALATAGNVTVWTGDLVRAHALYEELLEVATSAGFERGRANATINLGSLALLEGEPRRAARICAEAVALASELGDAETKAVSLFNLGCAHLEAGDAQVAARAFADSTRLCLDGGFREHLAYCLVGVAAVAEHRGDVHGAGVLLGAADAMLETMGAALAPYERMLHSRTTSSVRATLVEDADRVWSEGRRRVPEETLEAALARLR